jgi:hypothetical protein
MFKGVRGWQNAGVFSMYIFTFLLVFLNPLWVMVGMVIYMMGFGWLNAHVKLKKKENIEGVSFLDTLTVKGKKYSEPLLIGIKNYSELFLRPIEIESNEFFQDAKDRYIKEMQTKQYLEILMDVIASKTPMMDVKDLKKITDVKKSVLKRIKEYSELNEIPQKKDKKKKKKKKSKLEQLSEETEKELTEEQKIAKKVVKEAEKDNPDLETIQKEVNNYKPKIPIDKKKFDALGEFHAYDVDLFESLSFSDAMHSSHQFDKMILVTQKSFEDTFHFSTLSLWVDYYPVRGKASRCALSVIDWVDVNYPIMLTVWSEKDTIDAIDYQIDADKIRTIREVVMQGMIYEFRNYYKRFELQIEEVEAWKKAFYVNWQKAIQFLMKHKEDWLEDPTRPYDDSKISVNKYLYYGLIFWTLISIIIIGLILALSPLMYANINGTAT